VVIKNRNRSLEVIRAVLRIHHHGSQKSNLVSMYNHGSQNFEKSNNQPFHHQMVLGLFMKS
jgi:hypothetical protein